MEKSMKQVRFIDNGFGSHNECLKELPAERWPKDKEAAWELFKELLTECGRNDHAVKSKWHIDMVGDKKYCLVKKISLAPEIRWTLELVEVPVYKGIVVDMTSKNNDSHAKTYIYFVVFQYSRMATGVAACSENLNCEVRTNAPIKSIADIKKMESEITAFVRYPDLEYTVVNFILLDVSDT